MKEEEYLKNRLEEQINWYDMKSMHNQKRYKQLRVIEIIAAAAIPFLAGFISGDSIPIKIVIGLLGLIIVVITGIVTLYKFQENWIEYRTTSETLKHEKYLYLTANEPYDKKNPFKLLVHRVESLISKENTKWAGYIKSKKKEKNHSKNI